MELYPGFADYDSAGDLRVTYWCVAAPPRCAGEPTCDCVPCAAMFRAPADSSGYRPTWDSGRYGLYYGDSEDTHIASSTAPPSCREEDPGVHCGMSHY